MATIRIGSYYTHSYLLYKFMYATLVGIPIFAFLSLVSSPIRMTVLIKLNIYVESFKI